MSNQEFAECDVWVLVSLIYVQKPATPEMIRRAGDFVNHAIMTDEELFGGLKRLSTAAYAVEVLPNEWDISETTNQLNSKIDEIAKIQNDYSPGAAYSVAEQLLGFTID